MRKLNKLLTLLCLIMVVAFTACKKEPQPDLKEITVQCSVQGLQVQNLKAFDLSIWKYNYNPNTYILKFTGTKNNVYTYNMTIQQLSSSFELQVIPDVYTVSYVSEHIGISPENPLSRNLDICINQVVTINTITPVLLKATNDDELFILDMNWLSDGFIQENSVWNMMFNSPNPEKKYKYAYLNKHNEDVNFKYGIINSELAIINDFYKTITNVQKNKVYHIMSSFNGTSTVNILPFELELIGW